MTQSCKVPAQDGSESYVCQSACSADDSKNVVVLALGYHSIAQRRS